MNTNPRSSITRPVPRSPSLTFRISKRSARTIVSKLNPHSLPSSFSARHIHFPGESRVASDPASGSERSSSYQQIGGLSKKEWKVSRSDASFVRAEKTPFTLANKGVLLNRPTDICLESVCAGCLIFFIDSACDKAIVLIVVNAGSFIGG